MDTIERSALASKGIDEEKAINAADAKASLEDVPSGAPGIFTHYSLRLLLANNPIQENQTSRPYEAFPSSTGSWWYG
jgi:hypothetical protein